MTRLIDADLLRKNMEFVCMGIMAGTDTYNAPLTEIDNAPTVEIEETDAYKKGYNKGWRAGRGEQKRLHNLADERPIGDSEWIYEDTTADGYRVFYCKQCGAEVYLTDAYDECAYKYCHDCGRRMKAGKVEKS